MLIRMQAELLYFALSIAAGVLAAFLGSGMKWLHQRRKLAVWLSFLDLLYWLLFGFALFLLCFYQNSGIFRGYAVAGTLFGYCLFRAGEGALRRDGGWQRRRGVKGKNIKKRKRKKESKQEAELKLKPKQKKQK